MPSPARVDGPVTVSLSPRSGVRAVFTGRGHGNVSLLVGGGDAVAARTSLAPLCGAAAGRAVFMEQVHGARVAVVGPGDAGRGTQRHGDAVPAVDALVTETSGVPLVVLTADCVPVLLAGPTVVAAAHAGRDGLLAGVLEATVSIAGAHGDAPTDLVAVLGPSIRGCCYEVPADMAEAAADRLPATRATSTWGTPSLDLASGAVAVLRRAGVRRIAISADCTRCSTDRWFSHRAVHDGRAPRGTEGRQASVIARLEGVAAGSPAQDLPDSVEWLS